MKSGPPIKNLVGKQFFRLVVVERSGRNKFGRITWLCRCSCGKLKVATGNVLMRGVLKSCGCLKAEKFPGINVRHGYALRSKKHPVYRAWCSMKTRCKPHNRKFSKTYFERGIRVCKRWVEFKNFLADMEDSFKPGLTLHRKDNDAGYYKSNCKWADSFEQARHKTTNRRITINGKTKILSEWVNYFGISKPTFYQRINKGMSEIDALKSPLLKVPTR